MVHQIPWTDKNGGVVLWGGVLIPALEKPKDCTECPVCDEYDDCMLQPVAYRTWFDQYANCPMVAVPEYFEEDFNE